MKILLFVAGLVLVVAGIGIQITHIGRVRKLTYGLAELNDKREQLLGDSSLTGEEMAARQAEYDKIEDEYRERGISVLPYMKAQEQSKYYFGAMAVLISVGVVLCFVARPWARLSGGSNNPVDTNRK